ncbi:MAG: DUF1232 domain-containing protein [Chlorobi bacterium]|nr:DUF1232 domain-containing protein [Chlorobiota bacterium]
MENITEKQAKKIIKKGVKRISDLDLKKVIEKQGFIENIIEENKILKDTIKFVKLFISLVKDYVRGDYKVIPFWSIAAITFSLLYLVSPIDFVPDFIPFVGFVDDALILSTCYKMIKKDLKQYEKWRNEKNL